MKIDTAWAEAWFKDLRYATNSLAAQPAFTAMALFALVVGIALNVGVFTAINALWTRPWNVPEPERVVNAYAFNPKAGLGYSGFPLAGIRFLNDNSRRSVLAQGLQHSSLLGRCAWKPDILCCLRSMRAVPR